MHLYKTPEFKFYINFRRFYPAPFYSAKQVAYGMMLFNKIHRGLRGVTILEVKKDKSINCRADLYKFFESKIQEGLIFECHDILRESINRHKTLLQIEHIDTPLDQNGQYSLKFNE